MRLIKYSYHIRSYSYIIYIYIYIYIVIAIASFVIAVIIMCSYIHYVYLPVLKDELDHLIKAAEVGDIGTLRYLIQERKCNVDTRGPWGDPYVS